MRLAIPNNIIYDKLVENVNQAQLPEPVEIFRVEESRCLDFLINNRVSAALLSPIGYGKELIRTDLRIIPGPMIALHGFTQTASIIFKKNLFTINKVISPFPDDFLMIIGKILLAERYNIFTKITKNLDSNKLLSEDFDCIITYSKHEYSSSSLDISEDWHDTYQQPLPLGFWVCKAAETPENIEAILNSIAVPSLTEFQVIEENIHSSEHEARRGKIIYQWNEEIESALEHTFHILFYHQILNDIPGVKMLEE